jgi:hypothetical protein
MSTHIQPVGYPRNPVSCVFWVAMIPIRLECQSQSDTHHSWLQHNSINPEYILPTLGTTSKYVWMCRISATFYNPIGGYIGRGI